MSHQSIWFDTQLPSDIINILSEDIKKFDKDCVSSVVGNGPKSRADETIRKSNNAWIPASHWVYGFVWCYLFNANDGNFHYDLNGFDGNQLQYTHYDIGDFYNWHHDTIAKNNPEENIRKLSVVVQLSDPEEYEGGNLELISVIDERYVAPRKKGTVIVFDSRTKHRVTKIRSGHRRSIVGWATGPHWK